LNGNVYAASSVKNGNPQAAGRAGKSGGSNIRADLLKRLRWRQWQNPHQSYTLLPFAKLSRDSRILLENYYLAGDLQVRCSMSQNL
jgi:hypothetical protein